MSPFLHLSSEWKQNEWKEVVKCGFKVHLPKEVLLDCSMQILLEQQPRVAERIRYLCLSSHSNPFNRFAQHLLCTGHYPTFKTDMVTRT